MCLYNYFIIGPEVPKNLMLAAIGVGTGGAKGAMAPTDYTTSP